MVFKPGQTLTVTITGAAGQISYSLLPLIASGSVFGSDHPVNLHLLEIPPALPALSGVVMELEDLSAPLLRKVVATADPQEAFAGADVVILVGAFPRRKGMERGDLLAKNIPIFSSQGRIIAEVASKDVRIVVVGNPANTNAMILSHVAPSIPPRNITALTRLDHNRAVGLVARKVGAAPEDVKDIAIWGNHSATQYPDFTRAHVRGKPVFAELGGAEMVAAKVIPVIQKRGAAVIEARGASSAMSAAVAIGDHLGSWLIGDDQVVSMAVPSDGSYDIKEGIWFSFPVRCPGGGVYEIVNGIEIDEFSKSYIDKTNDELFAEKKEASALLD